MTRDGEYYYHALLTKVLDGNTVELVIDLGMDVSITTQVRLYACKAPDIITETGQESRDAVVRWLDKHAKASGAGWQVTVKTISDPERLGSYVVEVYEQHVIGSNRGAAHPQLNSWMISHGHAKVYRCVT